MEHLFAFVNRMYALCLRSRAGTCPATPFGSPAAPISPAPSANEGVRMARDALMASCASRIAVAPGTSNGILTIAKSTLPLVLFGPLGCGHRQGLLMLPARVAQARSPWLFGICLDRWGAGALLPSAALGLTAFIARLATSPRQQAATWHLHAITLSASCSRLRAAAQWVAAFIVIWSEQACFKTSH